MKNELRFTLGSKQRPKLAQEIGNIFGTEPYVCGHTYCSNIEKSRMNPKALQYLMGI